MLTIAQIKTTIRDILKGTGVLVEVHKSGDDLFLTLVTAYNSKFRSEEEFQKAFDSKLPAIKQGLPDYIINVQVSAGNVYKPPCGDKLTKKDRRKLYGKSKNKNGVIKCF